MNAQELIFKINAIDRSLNEDVLNKELDQWIVQIEEVEAIRALSDNFILKELLSKYRLKIEAIDKSLLSKTSDTLPDIKRDRIIDEKALYTDFIQSFSSQSADEKLQELARKIEQIHEQA